MEHIIVSNVMKHMDENKILSEYQYGFRNQRSCESQIIGLVHDLTSIIRCHLYLFHFSMTVQYFILLVHIHETDK
jgi:hypothetical protein